MTKREMEKRALELVTEVEGRIWSYLYHHKDIKKLAKVRREVFSDLQVLVQEYQETTPAGADTA